MKKSLPGITLYLFLLMTGTANAICGFGTESGDYCYIVSDGEVTIVDYIGAGGDVVIPDIIDGMPVVAIGNKAFQGYQHFTSVTISDGVTSIGNFAFEGCNGLFSISLPATLASLGAAVFDCKDLTSIIVDETNPFYSSLKGVLYNKAKTLLIEYPEGKLGGFTVPDGVIGIGNYAFFNCLGLSKVHIPDSVTSIGMNAFGGCANLTSVTLGNNVSEINDEAFGGCIRLKSIIIPDSVTSIGMGAFGSCRSLTSVSIPNGVTNIEGGVFSYCTDLISVSIPDSVSSIGIYAFRGCDSLPSVFLPDSVTSIGEGAFEDCTGLTSVTIPDSVTSIGDHAFSNCTGLTRANIGNSVASIKAYAFYACSSLTRIAIPASVNSIEDGVFWGCSVLSRAYFLGNAPTMQTYVFQSVSPDFKICYTTGAIGFTTPTWYGYPASDCACSHNSDCAEDEICKDGMCITCFLEITHQEIHSASLFKPRKRIVKITGDEGFDINGAIDLGPLTVLKSSINTKKNMLKIKALVPAGLEPGVIPASVGDCYGEIVITGEEN